MQFECPLCEERFAGTISNKRNTVQCPGCNHKFGPDGSAASNVPPPISKALAGVESQETPVTKTGNESDDDSVILNKPIPKRKSKSTWKAVATLFALTALCASLLGVLYYTITSAPGSEPDDRSMAMVAIDPNSESVRTGETDGAPENLGDLANGTVDSDATDQNESDDDPANSNDTEDALTKPEVKGTEPDSAQKAASKKAESDPDEQEIVKAPMKKPKFNMISARTADAVWDQTQPYLVSLEIESPFGKKRAVGMVVDSRGWMQTSLNACVGSKRIRVTESVNSLMRLQSKKPLTDLVRGVIAFEAEGDLTLLSINRRFTTLNKVQLSNRDFVVKGRRLIQCTPPSEEFPHPIAEVQILDRGQKGKLKKRNQALMDRIVDLNGGLKSQPIDWLVHSTNEATCPGAPLVDEDGIVQAVNAFQIDGMGFAVPIASLSKLISSSSNNPVASLASLAPANGSATSENSTVADTPTANSPSSDTDESSSKTELDVLPFGHPLRDASLALNQNAKACDAFDWSPVGQANYRQTQTAIESFYDVEQLLINHEHDNAITSTLSTQIKYWTEHIVAAQKTSNAAELIKNTNLAAANVIQSEPGYFMAMAKLEIVDVTSDLLIMKVVGTDCYISFPFDASIQPMRPDETWLLFGKTPPTENAKTRDIDSKMVTHYTVHIFHQLGKIKVE